MEDDSQGISIEEFSSLSGLPVPQSNSPLPVEYERAVELLVECQNFDQTRKWDCLSQALEKWGQIYADDRAVTEAKRLKLHAYRRMSDLAVMQAAQVKEARAGTLGNGPAPTRQVLLNAGFSDKKAREITAVGKLTPDEFQKTVTDEKPLSPSQVRMARVLSTPVLAEFNSGFALFRKVTIEADSKAMAIEIAASAARRKPISAVLSEVDHAIQWLQDFESVLRVQAEPTRRKVNRSRRAPRGGGFERSRHTQL